VSRTNNKENHLVRDHVETPVLDTALLKRQIQRARTIPPEFLPCRRGADGHHWEERQPDWRPDLPSVQARAAQCLVCGSQKRLEVSRKTGEVLRNRGWNPEGYATKRRKGDPPEPMISARAVRIVSAELRAKQTLRPLDSNE
jgi:hypothetical protein